MFALRPTSGAKFNIHYCLYNITTQVNRRETLFGASVIISLGFAANGYKLTRDEVNYSAGHVDDCSPNEVSRDEIAVSYTHLTLPTNREV